MGQANEITGDSESIPMGASFSDVQLNYILMKGENLSQLISSLSSGNFHSSCCKRGTLFGLYPFLDLISVRNGEPQIIAGLLAHQLPQDLDFSKEWI